MAKTFDNRRVQAFALRPNGHTNVHNSKGPTEPNTRKADSYLPISNGRYRIELRGPYRASSLVSAVGVPSRSARSHGGASARTCDLFFNGRYRIRTCDLLGVKNVRKYPIPVIFAYNLAFMPVLARSKWEL